MLGGTPHGRAAVGQAGPAFQLLPDCGTGLGVCGAMCAPQSGEDTVEAYPPCLSAVVSQCQANRRSGGALRRAWHWSRKTSSASRASSSGSFNRPARELAVLVVLDEVVVGVAGEGERVEP